MSQSLLSQTYYEILEVDPAAAQDEIHRAYQRAKQTYTGGSPALYSMFSAEETRELLKLIEEAYSVLGNQEARSRYDRQIAAPVERAGNDSTPSSPMNPGQSMPAQISLQQEAAPRPINEAGQVPEGFAKTRFGIYELNPLLEEEIDTSTEFSGEFIKKIRMYKKISLEDLSDHIRVSRTYINAIEMEDYEALPAPVFIRGFVSQMAKAIGLKDNKVAKAYMDRFKRITSE